MYWVSKDRITGVLRREGIRSNYKSTVTSKQRKEIRQRYREGASLGILASDLGLSRYYIKKTLEAAGIPVRPSLTDTTIFSLKQKRDIARRYKAEEDSTCESLALEYGVSSSTISNVLIATKTEGRYTGDSYSRDQQAKGKQAAQLWGEGKSSKTIAKILKIKRHKAATLVARYCTIDDRVRKMVHSILRISSQLQYEEIRQLIRYVRPYGTCEICREEGPLCVDHCHSTGYVRGLLCGQCNFGLGAFKERTGSLKAAIGYLGTTSKFLNK